jgi:hypothetical protein
MITPANYFFGIRAPFKHKVLEVDPANVTIDMEQILVTDFITEKLKITFP